MYCNRSDTSLWRMIWFSAYLVFSLPFFSTTSTSLFVDPSISPPQMLLLLLLSEETKNMVSRKISQLYYSCLREFSYSILFLFCPTLSFNFFLSFKCVFECLGVNKTFETFRRIDFRRYFSSSFPWSHNFAENRKTLSYSWKNSCWRCKMFNLNLAFFDCHNTKYTLSKLQTNRGITLKIIRIF